MDIYIRKEDLEELNKYALSSGMSKSGILVAGFKNLIGRKFTSKDTANYGNVAPTQVWKPIKTVKGAQKVMNTKVSDICKHGSMKGLCKFGCV
jgi:hypothetical protein